MIFIILNKIVNDNHCNWREYLPYNLWAYHTSIQMPKGDSPFSPFYGAENIMPLKLEIPSLHVYLKDLILDEDSHQA